MNGREVDLEPIGWPPRYPRLTAAQKVELLLYVLDGVGLGTFDVAVLRRLAGEPSATVRTLASLIARARVLGGWPPPA